MANNRMFLVHNPSKIGVMIAKHTNGYLWHAENLNVDNFYQYIAEHYPESFEDYILLMESDGIDWQYGEVNAQGFRQFIFNAEE